MNVLLQHNAALVRATQRRPSARITAFTAIPAFGSDANRSPLPTALAPHTTASAPTPGVSAILPLVLVRCLRSITLLPLLLPTALAPCRADRTGEVM